jgi:hypothetical protein
MRTIFLALALSALAACGQTETATPSATASGCAREATHQVAWTGAEATDVVTARSEGPSCAQAVVTLVIRNANGDALWAFASKHVDLTMGGAGPEGAPDVTDEQMDAFLQGWANVSMMRSTELPEWRADAETLSASVQELSYDTPFNREAYEMLRTSDLPLLCYAAGAESSQCLIIDPASNSPIMIVAFGA